MTKYAHRAALLALLLAAGCAKTSTPSTPASPSTAPPDVSVTVDGEHHACVVSKNSEPTGSTVSCAEVVAFMRDELRVRDGSSYRIRATPPVDQVQLDKVKAALDGAGFHFAGS